MIDTLCILIVCASLCYVAIRAVQLDARLDWFSERDQRQAQQPADREEPEQRGPSNRPPLPR